ncbi:DNA-binding response regulator, NarL/FixJ family, contains REC and HTH domains [Roseateles sp. YR242]|uniref:response regulator transcription factor n=1 Tax=Roseateles sp. YR242 TaxID=1855305 RepID=UPI0008CD9F51|nr:response regulator transcription factor [Roseateles sp. YR242]SEK25673.1 DNA-binding response regulator, NarL/FixJ family, contains REC and HTH domains [Roseateles sp. YR242]
MLNWPTQRIQVSVAYTDPLVAIGLSTVLSQQVDIDVVETDGRPAQGPHIVVADYERGLNLVASRTSPRERHAPAPKVLVITANDREHEVRSALEAGVEGYLELGCNVQDLVSGVRQLARGSRYLSAMAAQRIAASMARSTLTDREQQVLGLVSRGKSNKGVALALDISAGTVKAHMKAILSKLDAETRTEAASIAMERGLIAQGMLVS